MKLKNLSIALILGCALSSGVFAAGQPSKKDFGEVNFGYTVEEVKAAEKNSKLTLDSGDELIFTQIYGDTRSQNMYSFDDGKLIGALNNIVTDHSNLANYFKDFAKVDSYFEEIYGAPSEEIITTDDESILNDPEKLCKAIKAGEVMCCTIWKKDKYTITHILSDKLPVDDMDEEIIKKLTPSKIAHFVLGEINGLD